MKVLGCANTSDRGERNVLNPDKLGDKVAGEHVLSTSESDAHEVTAAPLSDLTCGTCGRCCLKPGTAIGSVKVPLELAVMLFSSGTGTGRINGDESQPPSVGVIGSTTCASPDLCATVAKKDLYTRGLKDCAGVVGEVIAVDGAEVPEAAPNTHDHS